MFPFTFFASEDISLVLVVICAILAWSFLRRHSALHEGLSLTIVGASLLAWCVLLVTGVLGPSEWPWDVAHRIAGHLLLPLVACPTGFWLGCSLATAGQRLALLLLGMCSFSNVRTGYLGPSRIDDPDTNLRFDVFHQVVLPCFVSIALIFWFRRLFVSHIVGSSLVRPTEQFT